MEIDKAIKFFWQFFIFFIKIKLKLFYFNLLIIILSILINIQPHFFITFNQSQYQCTTHLNLLFPPFVHFIYWLYESTQLLPSFIYLFIVIIILFKAGPRPRQVKPKPKSYQKIKFLSRKKAPFFRIKLNIYILWDRVAVIVLFPRNPRTPIKRGLRGIYIF